MHGPAHAVLASFSANHCTGPEHSSSPQLPKSLCLDRDVTTILLKTKDLFDMVVSEETNLIRDPYN